MLLKRIEQGSNTLKVLAKDANKMFGLDQWISKDYTVCVWSVFLVKII